MVGRKHILGWCEDPALRTRFESFYTSQRGTLFSVPGYLEDIRNARSTVQSNSQKSWGGVEVYVRSVRKYNLQGTYLHLCVEIDRKFDGSVDGAAERTDQNNARNGGGTAPAHVLESLNQREDDGKNASSIQGIIDGNVQDGGGQQDDNANADNNIVGNLSFGQLAILVGGIFGTGITVSIGTCCVFKHRRQAARKKHSEIVDKPGGKGQQRRAPLKSKDRRSNRPSILIA